jgi:transcriptional adapter 2-alpha
MSSVDFDVLVAGCVEEEELRRRIQQLQEYRRAGLRSFSQVQLFEQDQKHLDLYLKGGGSIMGILEPNTIVHQQTHQIHLKHPYATTSASNTTISPANTTFAQPLSRKASAPLNITNLEGYELLSEKERHICSILRLYPRLYLSIKDTLIREYLKNGFLRRAQARAAVKIDVNKTSKLYDFFVSAGWVRPATDGD